MLDRATSIVSLDCTISKNESIDFFKVTLVIRFIATETTPILSRSSICVKYELAYAISTTYLYPPEAISQPKKDIGRLIFCESLYQPSESPSCHIIQNWVSHYHPPPVVTPHQNLIWRSFRNRVSDHNILILYLFEEKPLLTINPVYLDENARK